MSEARPTRFARALWRSLPERTRAYAGSRLRRRLRPAWLGPLRRTSPLSDRWGLDRGWPVDRYYIERFLDRHRTDIRGHVLEIQDTLYTGRFGHSLERADVLDIDPHNPRATIVADLAAADAIASDSFDCFVLTQTLQLIYDVHGAVRHAHRILRPGGVLLASVPSVSRVVPRDEAAFDYWRFTPDACRRLFGDVFGNDNVSVEGHGNVLVAIAFLAGMAQEELRPRELDTVDVQFPVVVTVRAVKHEPRPR